MSCWCENCHEFCSDPNTMILLSVEHSWQVVLHNVSLWKGLLQHHLSWQNFIPDISSGIFPTLLQTQSPSISICTWLGSLWHLFCFSISSRHQMHSLAPMGLDKTTEHLDFLVIKLKHAENINHLKLQVLSKWTWIKGTLSCSWDFKVHLNCVFQILCRLKSWYSFLTPGVGFQNCSRYQVWDLVTL